MFRSTPKLAPIAAAALLGVALLSSTGCTHERTPAVPQSAMVGAEGNGPLSYLAGYAGTAYVFDATDGKLSWSSPVAKGQTISVDAAKNFVTVDGKTVLEKTLSPGH